MNPFINNIKTIASCLKKNNWQLVTAESCTGGLISSYLTEIPGSSEWFERGFVTYSNLAKHQMLGVPHALIKQFGAVSDEVALAMATGALEFSQGDIAVSVTGIAGPDGGSIEKPVGTVCLSWATRHREAYTIKKQFEGSREEIRMAACKEALDGLIKRLQ